jgi:hypothetical protein
LGFQFISSAQDESARIKELSQKSDMIITGKVSGKKSNWNKDKTRIYTKTTVEVEEYLKGESNQKSVEITTLGGEVGDVGEIYTHTAQFDEQEEVLVFLKKNERFEGYEVFKGEEGKIKVHKNAKTKDKNTSEDLGIRDLKKQIKNYLEEK